MDKKLFEETFNNNVVGSKSVFLMTDELDFLYKNLNAWAVDIAKDPMIEDNRFMCLSSGVGDSLNWYDKKCGDIYVSKDKIFVTLKKHTENFEYSFQLDEKTGLYKRNILYKRIDPNSDKEKVRKKVESQEFISSENGVEYSKGTLTEYNIMTNKFDVSTLTCSLIDDPKSNVVGVFKIESTKYNNVVGQAYSLSNYYNKAYIIPKNKIYYAYKDADTYFSIETYIKSGLKDNELRFPKSIVIDRIEFGKENNMKKNDDSELNDF